MTGKSGYVEISTTTVPVGKIIDSGLVAPMERRSIGTGVDASSSGLDISYLRNRGVQCVSNALENGLSFVHESSHTFL